MQPFRVDVPDSVLHDLRLRVERTRWPEPFDDPDWEYGTDWAFLREISDYWQRSFDWRAVESRINRWPQFVTEDSGELLHFVHARSEEPSALPLMMTHGWPGSVLEFLSVLGPLTDPGAFGGDPADAFHVVCPSIPGYAWSGPTRHRGWDIKKVSHMLVRLMRQLGYEHYGVQGGDWGAFASANCALLAPEQVVGLHINFVVAPPLSETEDVPVTAEEQRQLDAFDEYRLRESAYAMLQGTKPHSLAVGLNDSPAGLAAWIIEKFRTWSDCGGDVLEAFTLDDLLANVTTYWVTGTAASAARLYYETARSGRSGPLGGFDAFIETPTGCALFPKEVFQPPRGWAERQYNVVRWTQMPRGGHFAALEEPELLVDDIRAFFRPLR
jgi:pimeloyl-ACP methyl ester carboxylesterase